MVTSLLVVISVVMLISLVEDGMLTISLSLHNGHLLNLRTGVFVDN